MPTIIAHSKQKHNWSARFFKVTIRHYAFESYYTFAGYDKKQVRRIVKKSLAMTPAYKFSRIKKIELFNAKI